MAIREYFLGPKLGTTRKDVLEDIGRVGMGHMNSKLETRLKQILENENNTDPNLIIKIKVIDP